MSRFTAFARKHPRPPRIPPITSAMLARLIDACPTDTLIGIRNRFTFGFMWENALSREQAAVVTVEDIDNGTWKMGTTVRGYYQHWMAVRAAAGIPATGPVLIRINAENQFTRHGDQTALPLGGEAINEAVKGAVAAAGLRAPGRYDYSSTSLYLGGREGV